MKIVYRTGDYTDALIKKGLLEQAGFLVQMGNQNFGSTEVALGMVDGFTLNVVDDDFDEVSSLLAEVHRDSSDEQFFTACNGDGVESNLKGIRWPKSLRGWGLLVFLISLAMLSLEYQVNSGFPWLNSWLVPPIWR